MWRHIRVTADHRNAGHWVMDGTGCRHETLVNQELALAHLPMVLFVQRTVRIGAPSQIQMFGQTKPY